MTAAIKSALTPAALNTSNSSARQTFQLKNCSRNGVPTGDPITATVNSEVTDHMCLCAIWPAMDMEYNLEVMAKPTVHESAAKDILDGNLLLCMKSSECDA